MRKLPILFSAPMVRAILASRKTQTRRALKPKRGTTLADFTVDAGACLDGLGTRMELPLDKLNIPYAVGDLLWTRETLRFDWISNDWLYDADKATCVEVVGTELETPTPTRWPRGVCVSIHQPRHLSRITLRVTGVKVERLQDISEADAIAEGMVQDNCPGEESHGAWTGGVDFFHGWNAQGAFRRTWELINGASSWHANPWVAAYTFEPIFQNVDQVKA